MVDFNAEFTLEESQPIEATFKIVTVTEGGSTNYNDLSGKPSINSITLEGNKTSTDLGLQPAGSYATTTQLTSHTTDTSNPHSVTKTQVGLSNVDNTSDVNKPISTATQSALDLKVDRVVDKGLSTNDYTDIEQTKVSKIITTGDGTKYLSDNGIYQTVEGGVTSVNGETGDVILNIPTALSELSDDSDHRTVTDTEKSTWNSKQDALGFTPEDASNKNAASGYCPLDINKKVPLTNIPDSILGQLEYQGAWDASSGSYPVGAEKGQYWIANSNGTGSTISYLIGDWTVYNGTSFDKIDNTDAVASVNGQIGTVVLTNTDVGAVAANTAITGATKTKITYDSKGLVTGGTDATTADIAESTDKNYLSDSQKATCTRNASASQSGLLASADFTAFTTPLPNIFQGRLTLQSGVAVPTTDQSAKSVLYLTPYGGNKISLYNGSTWQIYTLSEISLTLSGLTSGKNYDVFVYNNNGTLTLSLGTAWTSDTARAEALATQDGILVKNGDTSKRFIGIIRAISATTTNDTMQYRYVANYYNTVSRNLIKAYNGVTWTVTTANVLQPFNNDSTNQVAFVSAIIQNFDYEATCACYASTLNSVYPHVGVTLSGGVSVGISEVSVSLAVTGLTPLSFTAPFLAVEGYSNITSLQFTTTTGTGTYNSYIKCGLFGIIRC